MSKDISSLTPDELSRWIALTNESSKNFENTCRDSMHGWWNRRYYDHGWIVTPRSYTDPEICLRLWIALFEEEDTSDERWITGEDKWVAIQRNIFRKFYHRLDCEQPLDEIVKRVIAEAYALANGYRPEGGE